MGQSCCTLTGYLARLVREPAWLMRRAPTISPISADRLGATLCIRSSRYACNLFAESSQRVFPQGEQKY